MVKHYTFKQVRVNKKTMANLRAPKRSTKAFQKNISKPFVNR